MKHMYEKTEMVVKKLDFMVQKQVIWLEELWVDNQTRKAKWCKTQVSFSNTDKMEGVKSPKQ